MPSGHVPVDALVHPELLGGLDCLISVPAPIIWELHQFMDEDHESILAVGQSRVYWLSRACVRGSG